MGDFLEKAKLGQILLLSEIILSKPNTFGKSQVTEIWFRKSELGKTGCKDSFWICILIVTIYGIKWSKMCIYSFHVVYFTNITIVFSFHVVEQPWSSGNALDKDQHGPGFEAQRRPLVISRRASGLKCSCQN